MIPFNIKQGQYSNMPNELTTGTIYYCIDTNEIYLDVEDVDGRKTRILFNDLATITTKGLMSADDKQIILDSEEHIENTENPHETTKAQVGLGEVDNTSDINKPISTAQATAINDAKKAGTDAQNNLNTHTNNKSNPHGVTVAQIGAAPSSHSHTNYVDLTSAQTVNAQKTFDGEQKFYNTSYCPTITDSAGGVGCAFKASRGLFNEALIDKMVMTGSTKKIPFMKYTGTSGGSMTGMTEVASIDENGALSTNGAVTVNNKDGLYTLREYNGISYKDQFYNMAYVPGSATTLNRWRNGEYQGGVAFGNNSTDWTYFAQILHKDGTTKYDLFGEHNTDKLKSVIQEMITNGEIQVGGAIKQIIKGYASGNGIITINCSITNPNKVIVLLDSGITGARKGEGANAGGGVYLRSVSTSSIQVCAEGASLNSSGSYTSTAVSFSYQIIEYM